MLFLFAWAALYAWLIKEFDHGIQFVAFIQSLKLLYYVCVELSILILGWKLLKKQITFESFLIISGTFVVLQYAGISLIRLFNFDTPILIIDILQSWQFYIPFLMIIAAYMAIDGKNLVCQVKTNKTVILVFLYLLILPVLCSINSYVYGKLAEERNQAEVGNLLNSLMIVNSYIRPVYYASIGLLILIMGIRLIAGNMSVLQYLGLGGSYIIIQYLGIAGIDDFLNLFKDFTSSNLNMVLHIMLDYKYTGTYFGFILLKILLLRKAKHA